MLEIASQLTLEDLAPALPLVRGQSHDRQAVTRAIAEYPHLALAAIGDSAEAIEGRAQTMQKEAATLLQIAAEIRPASRRPR